MTESADLARSVASQLGGDLDRILDSLPGSDGPPAPVAETPIPKLKKSDGNPEPLELCQVAGRGAGQRVLLVPGTYDIGPKTSPPGMPGSADPGMVAFRLHVSDNLAVTLTILDHRVSVDGRPITDGLRMKGGYIDAFSARFSLGPPADRAKPAPTSAQIIAALPPKKIPIAEIRGASMDKKSRKRNKRNRVAEDFPELTKAVFQSRGREIRRQRMLGPDACELLDRVKAGRPHIWNIDRSDKQFGVATLAYGEAQWTPPYDRPDKIRNEAAFAVSELLELPSVPISLDLQKNGLGIVGSREAALSVARHIAVSFCITTSPSDLELAVMASAEMTKDWTWTANLPHTGMSDTNPMPVLLIDGIAQIGAAELRAMLADSKNMAAIVIETELGDLPSICGNVLELRPDGSAALMDFRRGKTINNRATPVGMTELTAAEAAHAIQVAMSSARPQAQQATASLPEIAVPDHIKRPDSPAALPQRRR